MRVRPGLALTLVVLAFLGLLVACGGADEEPRTEPERVLSLRYWQAPSTPNAYLSAGSKDIDAAAVTLEPLASYNPEGELVPRLAVRIPTVANGGVAEDLTSITWTLREGVRWSDGSALSAADVVFTWRYCSDEATGCTGSDAFDGISSVEAIDALTVRITFEAPTPYPYTAFVSAGSPVISSAQFGGCVGAAAASCGAQNLAPLGTGPYRIVSFRPGEGVSYERNLHYRGDRPYFDRVEIVGDGTAEEAARAVLGTGEADFAWNLQIAPETLAALAGGGLGSVATAFAGDTERIVINYANPDPALGEDRSEHLGGANPHPFLTFAPITQALSMAIDRARIASELYGSAAAPTCNLVPGPERYVSTSNDACLTQDIEGARALLDEHGVIDTDGDGVREYEGVALRITYQTSTNAIRQATQALVREWWAELGIETTLVDHDAGVFFGGDPVADAAETYRRFFADVQMYTTGPGVDPQEYLSAQRCDHIAVRGNNWSGGNVGRWCNPEYDHLYGELARATGGEERAALVKRLNDLLVQGYAAIPLVHRGSVSAQLDTLRGVRPNAWDSDLWNIAEWRR